VDGQVMDESMNPRRVVVVDDNAQLRQLLSTLLQTDARFEVVGEAADGLEALRAIDEHDPELMLLDLSMPVMDGMEVLEQLAQRDRSPVTVVLSGYADEALRQQLLTAGAAQCVEKGLDFSKLTELLVATVPRPAHHGGG
jgi:CheY-like chemotaxis protein